MILSGACIDRRMMFLRRRHMLQLILSPDELGIGTVTNGNLMLGARVRETETNVVVMVFPHDTSFSLT